MTEHELYAHGSRTVDARLEIGEDGIQDEEVTNIGAPQPVTETYTCECGADFTEFADAKAHILEVSDRKS